MSDTTPASNHHPNAVVLRRLEQLGAAYSEAAFAGEPERAAEIKAETELYISKLPRDIVEDPAVRAVIRFTLAPMGNWGLLNPLGMNCVAAISEVIVGAVVLWWAVRYFPRKWWRRRA